MTPFIRAVTAVICGLAVFDATPLVASVCGGRCLPCWAYRGFLSMSTVSLLCHSVAVLIFCCRCSCLPAVPLSCPGVVALWKHFWGRNEMRGWANLFTRPSVTSLIRHANEVQLRASFACTRETHLNPTTQFLPPPTPIETNASPTLPVSYSPQVP